MGSWNVKEHDDLQVLKELASHSKSPKTYTKKDIPIIYEDRDILCIHKPSGLLSVAKNTANKNHSPQAHLLSILGTQLKICHRLDQATSGVMVLAKHHKSYETITKAFAEQKIQKTYYAVVCPIPTLKDTTTNKWSERSRISSSFKGGMITSQPTGKLARSDFQIIDIAKKHNTALLKCFPLTGKTHQIRVHLQAKNTACIGDPIYGEAAWHDLPKSFLGSLIKEYPSLLLHAYSLSIPKHRDNTLTIKTDPPPIFQQALKHFSLQMNNHS